MCCVTLDITVAGTCRLAVLIVNRLQSPCTVLLSASVYLSSVSFHSKNFSFANHIYTEAS